VDSLRDVKLILASGSPRRQQFFRDLGLDFEIRIKEVDEVFPPDLKGAAITRHIAKLKADAFDDLQPRELLVTSDTLVWHRGEALGKPRGYDDAFAMLSRLSGNAHQVFTSVCFRTTASCDIIDDETTVAFNDIGDAEIRHYLDRFKPFDKAGSYGIQDWIGLVGVRRIEGSYANVMGLPADKVYRYLAGFKFVP
jgi:septum formation protein